MNPTRRQLFLSRILAPALLAAPLAVLPCCGSVDVPEEVYYRLRMPAPAADADYAGGVLRVEEFRLAGTLSRDDLMVASGPVRLQPYQYHRWVAPLDRMVTDAVAVGMRRTGCFRDVVTATEAATADYVLSGQVLDFQQDVSRDHWYGVVTLAVRIASPDGGRVYLQDEIAATVGAARRHPEAGVEALSVALDRVCEQTLRRFGATGAFAAPGR